MNLGAFLILVSVLFLLSVSGTISDFAGYSSLLKKRQDIGQGKLNFLMVALDAGKLFGFVPARLANRFSPSAVLIPGAVTGCLCYGILFLVVIHKIYWLVVLMFFAGLSNSWIYTFCNKWLLQTFPNDQLGIANGILTSYAALTPNIFRELSEILCGKASDDDNDECASMYLLLNSLAPLVVSILVAVLRCTFGQKQMEGSKRGWRVAAFIAFLMGIYGVVSALVAKVRSAIPLVKLFIRLFLMILQVGVPLAVELWKAGKSPSPTGVEEISDVPSTAARVQPMDVEGGVNENEQPKSSKRGIKFWIFCGVYLCVAVVGMVFQNQLGQIAQTLGLPDAPLFLDLCSSSNFLGRLASVAPDFLASTKDRRLYRTKFFVMGMTAPMSLSFFLFIHPSIIIRKFCTAVLGFCTGAISSSAVPMMAELFGEENLLFNNSILTASIPLGDFIFSALSMLWDKCSFFGHLKVKPYVVIFCFSGFVCIVGAILSMILFNLMKKESSEKKNPVTEY